MIKVPITLFLLFFNIVNAFSDDFLKTKEEKLRHDQGTFDPKLWEHDNPGCPENSLCTKEVGEHMLLWKKTLSEIGKEKKKSNEILQKFLTQNGLPLKFWTNYQALDQFFPIAWNSPCPNHNFPIIKNEKESIYEGVSFVQSFEKNMAQLRILKNSYQIPFNHLFKLRPVAIQKKGDTTPIKFLIPVETVPNYYAIDTNELIILMEEEGLFFAIGINSLGKITIRDFDQKLATSMIEPSECSDEFKSLKDFFFKENFPSKFYKDIVCKKIPVKNAKTKGDFVFLVTTTQC